MVQKLTGRYAQGSGDSLDDVCGGVLTALLDIAQIALGHTGFIGKSLQGEVLVCAEPPDGQSYVVSESSLIHSFTPELESMPGCVQNKPYVLQCMGWHARMQ